MLTNKIFGYENSKLNYIEQIEKVLYKVDVVRKNNSNQDNISNQECFVKIKY